MPLPVDRQPLAGSPVDCARSRKLRDGVADDLERVEVRLAEGGDVVDLLEDGLPLLGGCVVKQRLLDVGLEFLGEVAGHGHAIVGDLGAIGEDHHRAWDVTVGDRVGAGIVEADPDLGLAIADGDDRGVMTAGEEASRSVSGSMPMVAKMVAGKM
jgi:hypothetical protein